MLKKPDIATSKPIHNDCINVTKTDSPNASDLPTCPTYYRDDHPILIFAVKGTTVMAPTHGKTFKSNRSTASLGQQANFMLENACHSALLVVTKALAKITLNVNL